MPKKKRLPDNRDPSRRKELVSGTPDRRSLQKDTPHSNPRFRTHDAYAAAAVCGFLLLAVALVFGQTVGHEFVHYDDRQYVFENPVVQKGLTLQGFRWAFTTGHASNWHPLTWLSHILDCKLFGSNPAAII